MFEVWFVISLFCAFSTFRFASGSIYISHAHSSLLSDVRRLVAAWTCDAFGTVIGLPAVILANETLTVVILPWTCFHHYRTLL
jgi:hypothetical protein